MTLNFEDIFKINSRVEQQIIDARNKFLFGSKTNAQISFDRNGEFLLSTIGYSTFPLLIHRDQEEIRSASLALTIGTEVLVPFVSVLLDKLPVFKEATSNPEICIKDSLSYLNSLNGKIVTLIDNFRTQDSFGTFASFYVDDIMLQPKAWTLIGCATGDLALFYSSYWFQNGLKLLIDNLGGPIAFINKISSSVNFVANSGLFLGVIFDKDLVSEDFYKIKVGNVPQIGSVGVDDFIELLSYSGAIPVYDAPNGNIQGLQASGVTGSVKNVINIDGIIWLEVDFDTGVDGWIASNFVNSAGNTPGSAISSVFFEDDKFKQCVLNTASSNNWQTIGQVTSLNCSNLDIFSLTGIQNFASLQTLDVSNNQLTSTIGLSSLTQLTNLNLSGNNISCTSIESLQQTLLNTTIIKPANCTQVTPTNFVWPVKNPIHTQGYAAYGEFVAGKYHTGFDLVSGSSGSDKYDVYAAAAGKVRILPDSTLGNYNHLMGNSIIIDHNNGQGPFTVYSHLALIDVANGANVVAGQKIGVMGKTGCEHAKDKDGNPDPCGVHLHFEVKAWDAIGAKGDDLGPWGYSESHPNLTGYINPYPYLDHGWQAFSPKIIRISANQSIKTGPGDGYTQNLGSVMQDQKFVATQQVGNWYEIDLPSENGPGKGWIQGEPVSENDTGYRKVTDPARGIIGVSVCNSPSACSNTANRLSYVWDAQHIVELESAPAQNGCTKPWIRTSLPGNQSGWVCGDFLTIGNTLPTATGKLNDTGITTCSNNSQNGLPCPVAGFPGQDAEQGRDALAQAGLLQKVGGGSAGFDFTKLDADGNPLPASATAWSCVKDNHTGLVWEEKTTSGLRSMHHAYTWYNPDSSTNGGHPGVQNGGNCSGSSCDTHGYVQAVNAQGLCGANDWRMPAHEELRSIVDYSRINPAIDTGYFPHIPSSWYWSASPYALSVNVAWGVGFHDGNGSTGYKAGNGLHVRLVRGGQ